MILKRYRERKESARVAGLLYKEAVDQARKPYFYAHLGVPDSLDGRFELIALHLFMLLNRLKGEGEEADLLAKDLYDAFFADMDRCLREMGAGDLGVGHKVQRMAEGFFGRLNAYDAACGPEAQEELSEVLRRNLFGTLEEVETNWLTTMADYVSQGNTFLSQVPVSQLLQGEVSFPGELTAKDNDD